MLLVTTEIRKTQVEVHVGATGQFTIMMPGDGNRRSLANAATLEAAKQAASVELRKRAVKVSVPFITRDGKKGVATGRHAGNQDILATLEDGTKERLDYRPHVFKIDTPKNVIDTYWEHNQSIQTHKDAMKAIESAWDFNLAAAVDNTVKEAAQEAE